MTRAAGDEATIRRRPLLGPLWLQVALGIACGILVGVLSPHRAIALRPLGDGFVKLIRMALAPIIFVTVAAGIARMGDLREVGRVGAKALLYFEIVSTAALAMGMAAANFLRPGAGMNIRPEMLDPSGISTYTVTAAQHSGVTEFFMQVIPSSIGAAFVDGNMLQIVLLGVLFGVALMQFRSKSEPLLELMELLLQAMFTIVKLVMYLAPLAAFGSMAYTVGQYGTGSLWKLAQFTGELWGVSLAFIVVVLGGIATAAGFSLWKLLRILREELLVTAGTSSSEAVLAPVMLKLRDLGCAESVVGMVMPAGYTFNADGTAIYLSMGALFIAQATNVHMGLRDQLVMLFVLMMTSKGSAGVAGAGFVTLAATLASMKTVPVAGLVLLLGVERLTNVSRAVTNVIGSSVATVVIAKWENAFDARQGASILSRRSKK